MCFFYLLYVTAPLGSIPELPAESCREIKASEGKDVISKKYWLDLSASGKTALVYCDMEIEEKAVDIAFVIGASGAQASSVFARMVAILKNFANEYEISDDKTRVALVDYNGPAIARVFFNDGYSKANFTSFMSSIPGPGGQPGTLSGAFTKVRDEVFTTHKGERLSAVNILVVLTQGNFDENSTEIRSEITNFRSSAVKVIVFVITEEPGIDKWEKISSGINLIVIPEPSKDTEEAKKLPHTVSKEFRSCAEVKAFGYSSDGHYLLHLSDSCKDPTRIYCHNMSSNTPQEFITLESGTENNFAIVYAQRLRNWDDCSGAVRSTLHSDRGTTYFNKVRLDFTTMKILSNVFTFAQTQGGKDIPYGKAGDCYSKNSGNCRKGQFKVDLSGTRLRVRDDVNWKFSGWPKNLTMQDYQKSPDGAVVSAKCGGWCGSCSPSQGFIVLEPLCSIPAG